MGADNFFCMCLFLHNATRMLTILAKNDFER